MGAGRGWWRGGVGVGVSGQEQLKRRKVISKSMQWLYAFGQACKEAFTKHLRQDKVIAAVSGGKKGTLLSGGEAGKDQSRVNARDLVNYSLFRVESER